MSEYDRLGCWRHPVLERSHLQQTVCFSVWGGGALSEGWGELMDTIFNYKAWRIYFYPRLVGALGHHGHKIGMYTSKYQWEPIMGSYTFGGNLPLWWRGSSFLAIVSVSILPVPFVSCFGLLFSTCKWLAKFSSSQWKVSEQNSYFKFLPPPPRRYAHYDNVQSFNDFRAFGGWKKPAIKQFKGEGCHNLSI